MQNILLLPPAIKKWSLNIKSLRIKLSVVCWVKKKKKINWSHKSSTRVERGIHGFSGQVDESKFIAHLSQLSVKRCWMCVRHYCSYALNRDSSRKLHNFPGTAFSVAIELLSKKLLKSVPGPFAMRAMKLHAFLYRRAIFRFSKFKHVAGPILAVRENGRINQCITWISINSSSLFENEEFSVVRQSEINLRFAWPPVSVPDHTRAQNAKLWRR